MYRNSKVLELKTAASKSFAIKNPEIKEIHDAGNTELHGLEPETFDIFAQMSADFEGAVPDSYRALNALVLDWVEENKDKLTEMIAPKVIEHYDHEGSEIDTSNFEKNKKGFIWEEQVDYMPMIDDGKGKLFFELELVFDIEDL